MERSMRIVFADEAYDGFEYAINHLSGFQGALRLEGDDTEPVQINGTDKDGNLHVHMLDPGGVPGPPAAFHISRVQSFYVY